MKFLKKKTGRFVFLKKQKSYKTLPFLNSLEPFMLSQTAPLGVTITDMA